MSYAEQLATVHQVAAQFWERDPNQVHEVLQDIKVIKRTGGKVVGLFPAFEEHPEVFFKVYFNNALEYELRGLQAVQSMPQVPGVTTPDVLHVDHEHKAILTVKRDWEDTTSPIKRFFVSSLGIDWYTVGRWLRAFHDSQASYTPNEKFLRHKFKKTEAHLGALQALFTPGQIDIMQGIIEDARAYFADEPLEWVISHGDFGLDNIKKKEKILEIIDFEDCQMAPRTFDLLNCLVRLEYATSFPNSPEKYKKLQNEFFRGYDYHPERSVGYDFFYLNIKLDTLETYHRRKNEGLRFSYKSLIFTFFERQVKRQLCHWLAERN